jgi:hypothetical protein
MTPAACYAASSGTSISAGAHPKTKRKRGDRVRKHTDRKKTGNLLAVCLLAAGLLLLSLPAAAGVQLQLDRSRITEGETVTLTFLTDDPRQSLEADFSPLEKDFEILDRRSETQLSIVNGRQAAVVRLLLTLEPRRAGELVIPVIEFGNSRTRETVLQVDKAPELAPGELPPVFIEVEVAPRQGPYYVHAQLGLVVRVFYQQNLSEAAISQPEPSPASVRLLQETPYQAERGGERYRVLERRYAIFPERSGELVLPAMQLSGRLVERRDSSIWQPTVQGRRITVKSEPQQLQIEPRPASYTGSDWQPARSLDLSQRISGTDALRVGEPVTRTVIIDAVGLEENMIAEPAWPELSGARIYPDQPQGISRDNGEWVLGHKEFRYAVVPEQEGELVLPELTVHWWDTENDRQQTAVLPAQVLNVRPSALVPPVPEALSGATSETAVPGGQPAPSTGPGTSTYWRWLTLLFAGLWLLTLLFFWRFRGRRGGSPTPVRAMVAGETELLDGLRRACERGDVTAARLGLLAWLREFGPEPAHGSLLEFAIRSGDPALRDGIYELDSRGFRQKAVEDPARGATGAWAGRAFWGQFENWRKSWRAQERERKPSLTDLYARANRTP